MATSTASNSSLPPSEVDPLKQRLEDLKDLFSSQAWHSFQEELVKVKRQVQDHAVLTRSSEDRDYYLSIARGINWILNDNFKERALQEAGQPIDNPEPVTHPMPLDSEGRRRLKAPQGANH